MIVRPFWLQRIDDAWQKRSIVWLAGVRRSGKTTLAKMLGNDILYLNCDLPSVTHMLSDPETFYHSNDKSSVIIFDEVHRVDSPSLLLKIAADEYPAIKILATGSSTLAATKKFRDALTGRKQTLFLPPVLWEECLNGFGITDLDRRLLHGGLPESLLAENIEPSFYSEWIDSFYARDIQELFGIRNRLGFLKLFRLLLRQSGQLLDYTNMSKLSELSRPTVKAHIEAMSIANALYLLPPFHAGGRREITHRPKCYGFDTGFVAFVNGWDSIRESDRGLLWEHLVLDTLRSHFPAAPLYFWRDKSNREIDFVLHSGRKNFAIECKINPDRFDKNALQVFRSHYPAGENFVVSPFLKMPYQHRHNDLVVHYSSLADFPALLQASLSKSNKL